MSVKNICTKKIQTNKVALLSFANIWSENSAVGGVTHQSCVRNLSHAPLHLVLASNHFVSVSIGLCKKLLYIVDTSSWQLHVVQLRSHALYKKLANSSRQGNTRTTAWRDADTAKSIASEDWARAAWEFFMNGKWQKCDDDEQPGVANKLNSSFNMYIVWFSVMWIRL